jgi:hypothetical protein
MQQGTYNAMLSYKEYEELDAFLDQADAIRKSGLNPDVAGRKILDLKLKLNDNVQQVIKNSAPLNMLQTDQPFGPKTNVGKTLLVELHNIPLNMISVEMMLTYQSFLRSELDKYDEDKKAIIAEFLNTTLGPFATSDKAIYERNKHKLKEDNQEFIPHLDEVTQEEFDANFDGLSDIYNYRAINLASIRMKAQALTGNDKRIDWAIRPVGVFESADEANDWLVQNPGVIMMDAYTVPIGTRSTLDSFKSMNENVRFASVNDPEIISMFNGERNKAHSNIKSTLKRMQDARRKANSKPVDREEDDMFDEMINQRTTQAGDIGKSVASIAGQPTQVTTIGGGVVTQQNITL